MAELNSKPGATNWRLVASYLATGATIMLIGGLAAGAFWGLPRLETSADKLVAAKPGPIAIAWPTLDGSTESKKSGGDRSLKSVSSRIAAVVQPVSTVPSEKTWLPQQFQEQVRKIAETSLEAAADEGALSQDPLARVGSALERSGWFDGRPTVRREPDGQIGIQGVWRIPAAVIRDGGRDYLIAWDGKPMPVVYDHGDSKLKAIVGVRVSPPGGGARIDYSKPWPGDDVQAGLELLRVISTQSWAAQVEAIDVGSFGKTGQLVIVSKRGGRVVWGGRPSKPLLGECGTPSKLATIDSLYRQFKSIDANRAQIEIWWEGRPLEIDVSATAQAAAGTDQAQPKPTGAFSPVPRR